MEKFCYIPNVQFSVLLIIFYHKYLLAYLHRTNIGIVFLWQIISIPTSLLKTASFDYSNQNQSATPFFIFAYQQHRVHNPDYLHDTNRPPQYDPLENTNTEKKVRYEEPQGESLLKNTYCVFFVFGMAYVLPTKEEQICKMLRITMPCISHIYRGNKLTVRDCGLGQILGQNHKNMTAKINANLSSLRDLLGTVTNFGSLLRKACNFDS